MQALINTIIVAALESYSDRLGNDGCNDMSVPNTPENLELVAAAQKEGTGEDYEVALSKNGNFINTCNSFVVDYVTETFKKQNNVDEKQVKEWVKHLS